MRGAYGCGGGAFCGALALLASVAMAEAHAAEVDRPFVNGFDLFAPPGIPRQSRQIERLYAREGGHVLRHRYG